jgi:predicted TIM-barrel fold metal-dependent hydrolase
VTRKILQRKTSRFKWLTGVLASAQHPYAAMLGDHVLMYASDYPHAESRFPDSVDKVLSWSSLGPAALRKLMWDNAVRFYGEP